MKELRFSQTHEWIRLSGDMAEIGISDYAQHSLGDVVFVDLPQIGSHYEAGEEFGAIESVKAASELNMPVSGTITAINETLIDHPELINQKPLESWLIKIKVTDASHFDHLLDAATYAKAHK